MYKVLLADDERIVLDSLRAIVPWTELGMELVALAENGAKAYQLALDLTPDIIITDIKMPLLSGLELIERLRAVDRDCEIIILSGYGEFALAQKAIRLGVRQYLLKPTRKNELVSVLTETVDLLNLKKRKREEERKELLDSMRFPIARSVLLDLVSNADNFSTVWTNASRELSLGQDNWATLAFLSKEGGTARRLFILRQMKTASINIVFPMIEDEDKFILLLNSSPGELQPFLRTAGNVLKTEEGRLEDMVRLLISSICQADNIQLVDMSGRVTGLRNCPPLFGRFRTIIGLKDSMDLDKLQQMVRSLFSQCELNEARAMLITLHYETGRGEIDLSFLQLLGNISNTQEIADMAMRLIESSRNDAGESYPVRTIKKYIKDHIDDPDLCLKTLSETVLFMNTGYLSRLFVKETGQRFSEYLNSARIDKAKNLIQAFPDMQMTEVASLVGFDSNSRYFSQVFRKYTGMTPTQWQTLVNKQKS